MNTDADRNPPPAEGRTADYLRALGVRELVPATTPFDPGYDPATVEAHLEQSSHLMADLKISMACWMIASEEATVRKIRAAREHGVKTVTGGGPFEVAAASGVLDRYLDLCAGLGFDGVECSEGFTDLSEKPEVVARMVHQRGLQLQCELGKKHDGAFDDAVLGGLLDRGRRWLDAGASHLVIEARERAENIGLFGSDGSLSTEQADRFAAVFGLDVVVFEAPDKPSQFALMEHFGPTVRLGNVRLEELLRVEIFRRGLHSDAFQIPQLTPRGTHASASQP